MNDPTAAPSVPAEVTLQPTLSEKLAEKLAEKLGLASVSLTTSRDGMENIHVPIASLLDAAVRLRDEHGFIRFIDLTVVDELELDPQQQHRFDVQVMLYSMVEKRWVRLHARTSEKAPSLTPQFVAAHNYEREAYDLFGVVFEGHPSLTRIMLPDGWQGHPLRKDDGFFNEEVDFTVTRETFNT